MKTAKQREDEFRSDLAELLKKHGAELTVTDDGRPYGFHRGVCLITMMSEWGDGEVKKDYAEFEIG